ncbi:EGF-like domain-containing protein 2 isoform X2 [Pomacea canaliculata]|uniref:EGF-like domain-containing protein 2 isoform X2 n=1 Tax=Pomacea canaliculata TaxID=400727 RepID=UPI000D72676E|nr:EGF-like domain-containing protein 2 isoform X2 [Pomacea canaliculata]
MVSMSRYLFLLLASVCLVPQVISQIHCMRPLQRCLNGGTCDSYTGQCHCAGAKGTLCQYPDATFTTEATTEICQRAVCANGSVCLEMKGTTTTTMGICACNMQQTGSLCSDPLYQMRCTREYVAFTFLVEAGESSTIGAVPLLHFDKQCMILSDRLAEIPGIVSGWHLLQGKALLHPSNECYNAIVSTEGVYSVYTLHYMMNYQSPLRVSEYDSVVSLKCKFNTQNSNDVQTSVEVRPLHQPDRKLDLHTRTATQGSFGDMKVLTSEGQPLPLQTALDIGETIIIEFPFSQIPILNDLTLGVTDVTAFPSDITSGIQPTILVENGCIAMPGAVPTIEKSPNFVKVHLRAFRFRQSDKLHLVFNISACRVQALCSCQDPSRQRRDVTTGTVTSTHSQGYAVTLKLKPSRDSTRLAPSFKGCLKTSEFSALLAMAAVATVAAVIALAVGGAVRFWSRHK